MERPRSLALPAGRSLRGGETRRTLLSDPDPWLAERHPARGSSGANGATHFSRARRLSCPAGGAPAFSPEEGPDARLAAHPRSFPLASLPVSRRDFLAATAAAGAAGGLLPRLSGADPARAAGVAVDIG